MHIQAVAIAEDLLFFFKDLGKEPSKKKFLTITTSEAGVAANTAKLNPG